MDGYGDVIAALTICVVGWLTYFLDKPVKRLTEEENK